MADMLSVRLLMPNSLNDLHLEKQVNNLTDPVLDIDRCFVLPSTTSDLSCRFSAGTVLQDLLTS